MLTMLYLDAFTGESSKKHTYILVVLFPEEVAETSQIFLQDTHILLKWFAYIHTTNALSTNYERNIHFSYEENCRRGGKPIAVWSLSISGVSANRLVAFYDDELNK
jgi:hypothetical protein